MKKKPSFSKAFVIAFVFFIGVNGILMGISMLPGSLSEQIPGGGSWSAVKSGYVELYGGIQRLLGKQQIENFSIFLNRYGKLVEPRSALSDAEIEGKASAFFPVTDHLNKKGIP